MAGAKGALGGHEVMHLKGLIQCFCQVEESRSSCLIVRKKFSDEVLVGWDAFPISHYDLILATAWVERQGFKHPVHLSPAETTADVLGPIPSQGP